MTNLDTNTAAVLPFPVAPKKPKRAKRTTNITEKECTARVTERQKYYDRGRGSVAGLYPALSPTNHPAMFWVRCTTNAGEEKPIKIGRFHPTELNVVRPWTSARSSASWRKSSSCAWRIAVGSTAVTERAIAVREHRRVRASQGGREDGQW